MKQSKKKREFCWWCFVTVFFFFAGLFGRDKFVTALWHIRHTRISVIFDVITIGVYCFKLTLIMHITSDVIWLLHSDCVWFCLNCPRFALKIQICVRWLKHFSSGFFTSKAIAIWHHAHTDLFSRLSNEINRLSANLSCIQFMQLNVQCSWSQRMNELLQREKIFGFDSLIDRIDDAQCVLFVEKCNKIPNRCSALPKQIF